MDYSNNDSFLILWLCYSSLYQCVHEACGPSLIAISSATVEGGTAMLWLESVLEIVMVPTVQSVSRKQ